MAAIGEAKTEGGKTVRGSFLPLREVALRLKRHPSTILRWLKKKKIPEVKGYKDSQDHWVFKDDDLPKFEEFMKSVREV